jgi:hypothetical protein
LTYGECSAKLPALKKEFVWLKEVDSIAIQSSVATLCVLIHVFSKNKAVPCVSNLRRTPYNLTPQNKQMKTLQLWETKLNCRDLLIVRISDSLVVLDLQNYNDEYKKMIDYESN